MDGGSFSERRARYRCQVMAGPARTLTVSVELPFPTGGASADPAALSAELRELWIIEQVRLHRIGVGRGAELTRMPRAAFMQLLGAHGVPVIDYEPDELQKELGPLGTP
jgi:predicted HTH domain antitoxin